MGSGVSGVGWLGWGADQSHSPGKLIGVAGGGEGAAQRKAGLDAAQDEAETARGDRHSEAGIP